MALNIEKVGRPLCVIKGGKYNNKVVSIHNESESDEVNKTFNSLSITDGIFQQVPNPMTEREVIYITGPSGSGKSTYLSKYCKEWKKKNKEGEIYVFSSLNDDECVDELKPKRIRIDDTLITEPLPIDEFNSSMCIFDDIDVISDKKIRDAVYGFLNQCLEIGRHHKINVIITNHLPTAGKDSRRILNECHSVVYFPHSGSMRGLKYLLENYIGLDKKDMQYAKKAKSRWCCIFKNYPQIMLTERNIKVLSSED